MDEDLQEIGIGCGRVEGIDDSMLSDDEEGDDVGDIGSKESNEDISLIDDAQCGTCALETLTPIWNIWTYDRDVERTMGSLKSVG